MVVFFVLERVFSKESFLENTGKIIKSISQIPTVFIVHSEKHFQILFHSTDIEQNLRNISRDKILSNFYFIFFMNDYFRNERSWVVSWKNFIVNVRKESTKERFVMKFFHSKKSIN